MGQAMLNALILRAKKAFKPKNIWLYAYAANRPAIKLYEKVGFRKIAVLPNWFFRYGRYIDKVEMLLKK